MSGSALKQAVTGKKEESKFPMMLEQHKAEIAKALPRHLSGDRMARIALTAFRRNPKLGECDPRSVFAAVIQAAQLGLEPDTLGRSYLIPYKVNKKIGNKWESHYECQFVPGWKGLVDLANRSGQTSVWTGAVFEGDIFDYGLGDTPFVKHKPIGEDDPLKITHVYAVGRIVGAAWPVIEVWPIAKVKRHRDRYNKVAEKHYSFENWEMYARKVPLLQVLKYMPLSPELATAVALSDAADVGSQGLTTKDAIEGTWAPVEQDPGAQYEQEQEAKAEAQQDRAKPDVVTYEQVEKRLRDATSVDALDLAIDFASQVPSQDRAKLVEIYKKLREDIIK